MDGDHFDKEGYVETDYLTKYEFNTKRIELTGEKTEHVIVHNHSVGIILEGNCEIDVYHTDESFWTSLKGDKFTNFFMLGEQRYVFKNTNPGEKVTIFIAQGYID